MSLEQRVVDVHECPACGDLYFDGDGRCCGRPLAAVDTAAVFDPPEVESLARVVFDISPTELVICRELMAAEEATVRDLARRLSRDRSVIQRHLSHLDDLNLVERRSRSLPDGGRVNVYAPKPVDEVRRRLQLGLSAWVTEAEGRIDDLTREKVETMVQGAEMADDEEDSTAAASWDDASVTGGDEAPPSEGSGSLVTRLLDRWRSR